MVKGIGRTVMIVVFLFLAFIGIILLGIFAYGMNLFDDTFSQIELNLSGTDFQDVYNETLAQGIVAAQDLSDTWGITLLLGMAISMVMFGFIFKEDRRMWFVAEIIILIVAIIISIALQRGYSEVINSSAELLNLYSTDLIKSSKFMLNLPTITTVLWFFIVVLSYSRIKKEPEQQTGGFQDLEY